MNRRGFLGGLLAFSAAPAIIRTPGLLMPIRSERPAWTPIKCSSIRSDHIAVGSISVDKIRAGALTWDITGQVLFVFSGSSWRKLMPGEFDPRPSGVRPIPSWRLTEAPQVLPA